MNTEQRDEIESHQRFLASCRARIDALPAPDLTEVDPEDDTFDAAEDPPHRTENTR
jgi:hypothetical protein